MSGLSDPPVTFVRAEALLIARFGAEPEWVVYDAAECSMAVVQGNPPSVPALIHSNDEPAS